MAKQQTQQDTLQPHNVDAEEGLLGSLLIDSDAIMRVATLIDEKDFFVIKNGWIYAAMKSLHDKRAPIDFITLSDELEKQGRLMEVGGPAFLTSLTGLVFNSMHLEYYANMVEEAAILREVIDVAGQAARMAYEEGNSASEVVDRVRELIGKVGKRNDGGGLQHFGGALYRQCDYLNYVITNGIVPGVMTGLMDLDNLLGGLQKQDLIVMAARPGVGKSGLATTITLNTAKVGKRVGIFTLEMSDDQLAQRMLAIESEMDVMKIRLGRNATVEEAKYLKKVAYDMQKLPVYIDDKGGISLEYLRNESLRLHAEIGLDLLIVDYLQLMAGRGENRQVEVSNISKGLKALAKELDIPIIALSQLSRQVESRADKRPILSDLRESGCLTGDTLIYLPDKGQYVPIQELVGQADIKVLSLDTHTWKLQHGQVTHAFCTGVKPVYRLTTQLGRTIRATGNHKFLTIQGWKRLDELDMNDHLALPRCLPDTENASPMSDKELALLGHLIGDGCTLPTHAIQYTTREKDLAEIVQTLASEVFGNDVAPRINKEQNWYQVYLASTRKHTHGVRSVITEWLTSLGIFGLRSHEKRVPMRVFNQPNAQIARFLCHLWVTDGCVYFSKVTKKQYLAIYYASSSEDLARDVQALLLRLNINARLSKVSQQGKGRDQYHVTISGHSDIEQFIQVIGTVGSYKQSSLENIKHYLKNRVANTNRDIIPKDVWRMEVVPAMKREGLSSRAMQAALGMAYNGTGLYRHNLSRERAWHVAQHVNSRPLANLAQSDVYWDKIASIEMTGEEKVYDLTVDTWHNFLANDIIVHNSIEQDADVVLFIYRDEMYNEDTEFPNIAELIVAKHRNGETGKVNAFFKKQFTQFCDAEVKSQPLDY